MYHKINKLICNSSINIQLCNNTMKFEPISNKKPLRSRLRSFTVLYQLFLIGSAQYRFSSKEK